jgi:hypothetical protein
MNGQYLSILAFEIGEAFVGLHRWIDRFHSERPLKF